MQGRLLIGVREADQRAFVPGLAEQLHADWELLADEADRDGDHRPLSCTANERQRSLGRLSTIAQQ
jgi:hypothetical protein